MYLEDDGVALRVYSRRRKSTYIFCLETAINRTEIKSYEIP